MWKINEQVAAIRATITSNRERLDQLRSRQQAAESEEEAESITEEMDQILQEFGTLEFGLNAPTGAVRAWPSSHAWSPHSSFQPFGFSLSSAASAPFSNSHARSAIAPQ